MKETHQMSEFSWARSNAEQGGGITHEATVRRPQSLARALPHRRRQMKLAYNQPRDRLGSRIKPWCLERVRAQEATVEKWKSYRNDEKIVFLRGNVRHTGEPRHGRVEPRPRHGGEVRTLSTIATKSVQRPPKCKGPNMPGGDQIRQSVN